MIVGARYDRLTVDGGFVAVFKFFELVERAVHLIAQAVSSNHLEALSVHTNHLQLTSVRTPKRCLSVTEYEYSELVSKGKRKEGRHTIEGM